MLPTAVTYCLAELAEDNQSGASWLVTEAAQAVAAGLAQHTAAEVAALLPDLAQAIADTRPSMAPFWNLANALALAAETEREEHVLRRVAEVCAGYSDGVAQRLGQVARRAAAVLAPHPRVLVHSLSHTVIAALQQAHAAGTVQLVVCTEGAPILEGRALAANLARDGMNVVSTTDAGAFAVFDDIDAVVLGSDAVGTAGLRNKTGTLGLAAAAHHARLPVFVLCDSTKFVPAQYVDALPIVAKDPDEVWDRPPGGVDVLNYYFDLTPLDLLTAVVSEHAVLDPPALTATLESLPVARMWSER